VADARLYIAPAPCPLDAAAMTDLAVLALATRLKRTAMIHFHSG
jgi:hypothetical protein